MVRFRRTMSALLRRPMRLPILDFGTVPILSTIKRDGVLSPLISLGSTGTRKIGVSVKSEVIRQTMMDRVPGKMSSWTITAGRGLPA